MNDKDSRTKHQNQLDQRTNGGGCTETWEALSEMRQSGPSTGRRSFVKRVGLTIGAIPFGVSTATADNSSGSTSDPDVDIDARPLRGQERGQLLREANTSDQLEFVVEQLGEKPGVSHVFEYTVGDDSGRGVTYGDPEEEGPVIRYYESAAFKETDVKVLGGYGLDEEETTVRTVDGDRGVVTDIHTMEAINAAKSHVGTDGQAMSESRRLAISDAVMSRDVDDPNDPFDIYVPVVENDQIVDRLVISGTGGPQAPESVAVEAGTLGSDDQISTQGHVVCDPWGYVCTDYCTVLCSSLAGLAGSGCFAACAGTVAGIPISPACGAVCAGVVGGTCYPTCENQVGH